jgi:hypothetical protein
MPSGQGIVLSDRPGTNQAFWHEGTISSADLVKTLQKTAHLQVAAQTTETNYVSHFTPSAAVPVMQQAVQPSFFGGFGGRACST